MFKGITFSSQHMNHRDPDSDQYCSETLSLTLQSLLGKPNKGQGHH